MEPEGSSPHSQVPATCPYPEPAQSSSHILIQPPEGPLQYIYIYKHTHTHTHHVILYCSVSGMLN